MAKLIGIVAGQADEDYIGVHKDLMALVEEINCTPIIIPPVEPQDFVRLFKGLDGYLLPGGSDINPERFGEKFSYYTGWQNPYLEYFDTYNLPLIIAQGIPIFGICRGFQSLNVIFGGTLNQHLFWHPHSDYREHLVHEVEIHGDKKYKVNSFHHQGIKVLANDFDILAISKDNIIEAFQHSTRKIVGVQWHPERSFDSFSLKLMKETFA